MDVAYINPFIESTISNVEKLTSLKVTKLPVSISKVAGMNYDLSAIIGLTGDLVGSAVISLKTKLALKIASVMFMESLTQINDDAKDAIGEFTNIIVGHARNAFVNEGLNIVISTPTIVLGGKVEISPPKGLPFIVVGFETAFGKFMISVSIHKDNK
jgi:chemotaxis protein CheX